MRAVLAVPLFFVAAFCVYGFIASGEPGANNFYFRVGYPVVGVVCLALAVALFAGGRKSQ